ncbi:MAG: MFS transporter [Microgenomates group bacterium]
MRNFYHLLANNTLAGITNFTVWFAMIFYSYLQTESVLVTGVISGIFMVANAVSGVWFGSLVDNYKKKTMMLIASVISLLTFIAGFVIYQTAATDAFTTQDSPVLWGFILVLMLGVIVGGIRAIAIPTIVTIVAPEGERDKANGLVGTTNGVSFLVTSVISGLLVGSSGMYGVLILAMVATLISIVDLWFIPVAEREVVHIHGEEPQGKSMDIRGTIKLILGIPGFAALIAFTTFNNFLGGVFMALMDAYGLSLVSVETWGLLWGVLSTGFILGGIIISKFGLGKNPLRSLFLANLVIWAVCSVFTIYPSIILLSIGMYIYITVVPYIEASEQTLIQKIVPADRQGRLFGFAHSVEQSASPLTAFLIGPLTQNYFIPFMTDGAGVDLIGSWFGTGSDRGIALVFTLTGIIGFIVTACVRKSKSTQMLADAYLNHNASAKEVSAKTATT